MTNSIKYLSYILSIISIILTKASSNIQTNIYESINNISLNSSYKDIYNQTEKINYFLIIQNNTDIINSTNYIKMQIKNLNNEINHNVISYYHNDSTFSERKQLSHNIGNTTYLLLTKDQIENDFYISIEFYIIPCIYELEILLLKNIELNLGEQFSYFVTKENKKMLFDIIGKLNTKNHIRKNNTIILWVKGNKEITLQFDTSSNPYYKHPKYNVYIINYGNGYDIINNNNFLFNLEINGNEGDLINIGTLFFDSSDLCSKLFSDRQEIMGFLKKNIKDINCYTYPQNIKNIFFQKGVYENKEINIDYYYNNKFCVSLPAGYDEVIYTLYSFQTNNNKNNYLIRFSPLINNIEYFNEINKNLTVGLIPTKQNDDINYISYFLNPLNGKYKVGIYICETYPLCYIDSNITYEELNYINSFSLTYSKSEDDIYLNQISKKKKIIIIKSETNLSEKDENKNNFYLTIYNQHYTTLLKPDMIYAKYTRKTTSENYLIKYKNEEDIKSIYIFIEFISGYIEINDFEPQTFKKYRKDRNILYIININNNTPTKISFKIDSKENSFYKINYIKNTEEDEIKFNFYDGNYLFNLNKTKSIIINPNKLDFDDTLRFLSFYSINCTFNIKSDNNNKNKRVENNKNNNFYQIIYRSKDINNNFLSYHLSKIAQKNNNGNQSCLFYMSLFRLNSIDSNYLNCIILSNNISQYFIFNNKTNYTFNSIYLFTNTNNNLFIEIKLFDKEQYELILFYDENNNETIEIESDITQTIDSNILKNICINLYQICFIKFSIKSKRYLNESKIVINPNFNGNNLNTEEIEDNQNDKKIEDDDNDDEKFFDFDNPLFMLGIVGALFLLLIIFVIIIGIYFTCKNKRLIDDVNTISFKYDDNICKDNNAHDDNNKDEKYDNMLEDNFSDIDSEKH